MKNWNLCKSLLFVIAIGLCITSCSKGGNSNDPIEKESEENTTLNMLQGSWIEDPSYKSIENFLYTFKSDGTIILHVYNKSELSESFSGTFIASGNSIIVTDNEGSSQWTIETLTSSKLVIKTSEGELLTFSKK